MRRRVRVRGWRVPAPFRYCAPWNWLRNSRSASARERAPPEVVHAAVLGVRPRDGGLLFELLFSFSEFFSLFLWGFSSGLF